MTTEPYSIRTVSIRAPMPPKEDREFIPPPPGFLFKDARMCNRRMAKVNGHSCQVAAAQDANERSRLDAIQRRAARAKLILDILQDRTMTSRQIHAQLDDLSFEQTRVVLRMMKLEGLADFTKGPGGVAMWRAV